MQSGQSPIRLSQLWQWPLFLFSIALFSYAAYLFIDPQGGPTVPQRLAAARSLLDQERADAAIEVLNALLNESKVKAEQRGAAHILLGEALELAQRLRRLNIPINHQRIIEQTRRGMDLGIAADSATHRRLAESYQALGRYSEAIYHYGQAAALEPRSALMWQRRVIELQLAREENDAALASIDEYLKHPELASSERAWAMGEKARVMVDGGSFAEAGKLLESAMQLAPQESERGQLSYWLGYCQWKLGQLAEAERLMRVARDLLRVQHPLDADAAYALGRIRQEQKDYAGASSFYAAVLQSHLDSRWAPFARLGRAICRIAVGDDDAGLKDLEDLVRLIGERQSLPARLRQQAIEELQAAMTILSTRGNYVGALEVLAYERELRPTPPPDFFERLARVYEKRAEQIDMVAADLPGADRRKVEVRELRVKAAEAHVALARALTLTDDRGYGQALWKAIELFDRAGDLARQVAVLETFTNERPDDPMAPDALLKLGQSYHALHQYDRAVSAYRRNQFRYPKSLAASRSGVPLARAYVAQGAEFYPKAEEALLAVVENNPQITPDAVEFREALWELVNLYCWTGRYELAVARTEEMAQRYPDEPRMGQMLFLMADSYRKSAGVLEERIAAARAATTRPALDLSEAAAARSQRLQRAEELYAQASEWYRAHAPTRDIDRLYMKLAYFYRGDCAYDLGKYEEAIRLYGDAAFRYQEDALALTAYVQIVNANVALGKTEEAKAANERAKWMLRRMPQEAFTEATGGMSRAYWEQWLKWSGESGLWK